MWGAESAEIFQTPYQLANLKYCCSTAATTTVEARIEGRMDAWKASTRVYKAKKPSVFPVHLLLVLLLYCMHEVCYNEGREKSQHEEMPKR